MAPHYDLVIAGGGVAGSSLAAVMARAGAHVALVEQEERFKDRVRGESILPWGLAEIHALGLVETFQRAGAHAAPMLQLVAGEAFPLRPLPESTPQQLPALSFFHPAAQEALCQYAGESGADVLRPTSVTRIAGGARPQVELSDGRTLTARLIVIADGRRSMLRSQAGFSVQRDQHTLLLAGVLLEGVTAPVDTNWICYDLAGRGAYAFPQGGGRMRVYLGYWPEMVPRIQGEADFPRFLQELRWAGDLYPHIASARLAGPLASFETADWWVPSPYKDGIALLGDAASSNDPSSGQGLSLAMRDARVLSQQLIQTSDWDAAARAYAAEHSRYYSVVHSVTDWVRDLFLGTGAEADATRARALPLIAEDPTRVPDVHYSGPDIPVPANARDRLFGLDVIGGAAAGGD